MAFKITLNRSHLRVVHEVEEIGGNVIASASREQMGYSYDDLRSYVPQIVELLVDSIEKVKVEIVEYANNPLLTSEGLINRINNTLLEDFVVANYTTPCMVLDASGVEHEELLKYAKHLLSDLPSGT
ncbi:hypothetical protein Lser_V15G01823 [Lactuca serriola]